MSRTAHFEIWTGLAGDMFVGAFLDAGWPEDSLQSLVRRLGIPELRVSVESRKHGSLVGKGIRVEGEPDPPHRHLEDVARILEAAELDSGVRDRALRVFRALAEAEARVHGTDVEAVHFHEVGALDAIVDVAAAVQAVYEMEVETLTADPIPIHRGRVDCAHGTLPTPAPATGFLLSGWPVVAGEGEGEWITPTAAALLQVLATPRRNLPSLTVDSVGLGAGTKSHPTLPNLTRLWIGEEEGVAGAPESDAQIHPVTVLETQVDDLTGEEAGWLADRVRESGALDVTLEPIYMKKGRPGLLLRTLVRPEAEAATVRLLFEHSSTLGVRSRVERRWERWREVRRVTTPWGEIGVKYYSAPRGTRWSIEFDDLSRLAAREGVSVAEIRDLVERFLQTRSGPQA